MNNIKQCKFCGKLFNYIGNGLCPDCVRHMDESQLLVRDYLHEHPGADVKQISEGTELEERTVLYLLKEGILSVNSEVSIDSGLRCSMCGKPVSFGKICEGCRTSLGKKLNSVLPDPAKNSTAKKKKGMHIGFR